MTIHLTRKIIQFLAGRLQASRTVKRERWSPTGFRSAQEGSDRVGLTGIEVALRRGGGYAGAAVRYTEIQGPTPVPVNR